RRCHRAGQAKPTPLLLRYGAGGNNRLHQDLYGALVFPMQLTIQLRRPGIDFEGGEFLLVEQHPREQSIGIAFALRQGEGVIFPTRDRPAAGKRGFRRVNVRHGVSLVTSGDRLTLGIIFHDAA
ncbi:MAG TPA: 2OG-Fe(II) oxygenase, partial [Candidatus Polarisedimenticolia bacterium]|nr:2OG-Fe(II) oxygenase [Candidatus Polarisedimenticolia bacterium]